MPGPGKIIDEEKLPPLHQWLLLHVRKYGPLLAADLREELETMRRNGADMRGLNVDGIHLALADLERGGLIKPGTGGWIGVPIELASKQKGLF